MKLRWVTFLYSTGLNALPLELGVVTHPKNEFPDEAAVGIGIEAYDALYSERSQLYEEDIILAGSQYRIDYRGMGFSDFWQIRPQIAYRKLEYSIEPLALASKSNDTRERSEFSLTNRWKLVEFFYLTAGLSFKDQSRRVSNFSANSRETINSREFSIAFSYQNQLRYLMAEFRPGYDNLDGSYRLVEPDRYRLAFYLPLGSVWGLSSSTLFSLHNQISKNRKDNLRQAIGLERQLNQGLAVGMALDYASSSYADENIVSFSSLQAYSWSLSSKYKIYEDTDLDFKLAMRYGSEKRGLSWDSQVLEVSFTHFLWHAARKDTIE